MNFVVCIISIIGIIFNCFIIFNSSLILNNDNINNKVVDNVDKVLCSNDEILTDKIDIF